MNALHLDGFGGVDENAPPGQLKRSALFGKMQVVHKRAVFGILGVLFIAFTLLWLRLLHRGGWDDRNYWIRYLGFCILLEISYVSLHFLLKALFLERPVLVTVATRIAALLVAIPVTIVATLLFLFIGAAMIGERTDILKYVEDLSFILAALGVPAFFLWRHVVRALTRAEQVVGPERG